MNLSIGIVGLPNVGKSTLFKALTKKNVNIANYPFATIDPNIGVVELYDERLFKLAQLNNSKKIIPAIIEFYDIAGLVKNAYKGEGLGNQFLSHIREVNAILHLVRIFRNDEIIHVEKEVNPLKDIEIIETELILKDLETLEKKINKIEKEVKNQNEKNINLKNKLINFKRYLNEGKLLFTEPYLIQENKELIKELNLLTAKPQIFLLNGKISEIDNKLILKIKNLNSEYLIFNLNENNDFYLKKLIKKCYQILNLISFFTISEKESRAWTIENGTTIKKAGSIIHSDFENKFIKAEVINWQDLINVGSFQQARKRGLIKIEGKNYLVKDGDVIVFKHN